ncbi:MAG TPA: hypothetical protein VFR67_10095, partial [Pilimelia sp.]|nr:hypothetical protein [Pilimelia sp.]
MLAALRFVAAGSTAPFALAAARVTTLNLRFAYHPGDFDATLLDVREVTFEMTLVENGPDGPTILATDFDIAPVLRMAVYFTGIPARLRAGISDTFAIRYTNASETGTSPSARPCLSTPYCRTSTRRTSSWSGSTRRRRRGASCPWSKPTTARPLSSPKNTPSRHVHNRRRRSTCG